MALHERPAKSDEWYTPPHVFEALGERFDMDVASPGAEIVPWVPAFDHLTANGLIAPWQGFVWMNAPFGGRNGLAPWLTRFFGHGEGIALTPDRTSAPWWQFFASHADAILFLAPKIHFIPGNGAVASSPAQGTTLFAAGPRAKAALIRAEALGAGLYLAPNPSSFQHRGSQ
jgi:hypothetical protein